MRSLDEIHRLLDRLDHQIADDLESQDLDFKEWKFRSIRDALAMVVEMAVCMANGDGGTVVFGVADRVKGRNLALTGVPVEIDANRLMRAVYDATDPKLTPRFEELRIPEGTGRLLLMQVHGGLPPYTDTQGQAKIRRGKDCVPLTGSLRRQVMVETGETDYTAVMVEGSPDELLSPSALEQLRDAARAERAPTDLLARSDRALLESLHVLRDGRLTRAGVLLAGRPEAVRAQFPRYDWTHLRMSSETRYQDREDGHDALPVALNRLLQRIMADNPITTVESGLYHFEYRTYPELALREALLNALCHGDFRLGGPVLVKQLPERLEISNPGGFIGGISPENILHHRPVARNPLLVSALLSLRVVNRSNLGVGRMFEAMLIEGKAPPRIVDEGEAVKLSFRRQVMSAAFRGFVAEEGKRGHLLEVDHLLVLHHLLEQPEVDTATAARLCQQDEEAARAVLNALEVHFGYLERGGTGGRGSYWTLRPDLYRKLGGSGNPERNRRIDWEAAKMRVVSILQERARRGEEGLKNEELRQITRLNRKQVVRLMLELRAEHPEITDPGRGRSAGYRWQK